jgi:hypothetical protein
MTRFIIPVTWTGLGRRFVARNVKIWWGRAQGVLWVNFGLEGGGAAAVSQRLLTVFLQ